LYESKILISKGDDLRTRQWLKCKGLEIEYCGGWVWGRKGVDRKKGEGRHRK
jgi:hypothetical protein